MNKTPFFNIHNRKKLHLMMLLGVKRQPITDPSDLPQVQEWASHPDGGEPRKGLRPRRFCGSGVQEHEEISCKFEDFSTHDGSMYAIICYIYGVPWIPSIYPSHVSIYTIHGSYGVGKSSKQTVDLTNLLFDSQRPYEAIS